MEWLTGFWGSIQSLRSFSHGLMWTAVIFAVLSAGATWLRYYIDRRVGELSKAEQAKRESLLQENLETKIRDVESSGAAAQAKRESLLKEDLETKIRDAEAAAANAKGLAEKERLARLKIEESLAPRELNADQQGKLATLLRKFSGTEFEIRVFKDPEPLKLLNILVEVLHSAGWVQKPVEAAMEISTKYGVAGFTLDTGVRIRIDPRYPKFMAGANALVTGLVAERIDAVVTEAALEIHPERMHIAIGKKR